jgi:hypothetical protein
MSDQPQATEIKGTRSAKEISKWSMVVAALWIGILSIIKAVWSLFVHPIVLETGLIQAAPEFGLTMNDIIVSGLALAAVFTPIYFSIFLEKIKEIRTGRAE